MISQIYEVGVHESFSKGAKAVKGFMRDGLSTASEIMTARLHMYSPEFGSHGTGNSAASGAPA